MRSDLRPIHARLRRLRVDVNDPEAVEAPTGRVLAALAVLAMAVGFVLIGADWLDLGHDEARLGLAAAEPFGPLGRVAGGWDPALWPARVLPSWLWACTEEGFPTGGSVRWPAALATVGIGLIVARSLGRALGQRAGLLAGLAFLGSLAAIDHAGPDPIAGLAVVAALARILDRGTDRVAGLWAALALLAGGWPALAIILLPCVVLGRPGRGFSAGLLVPPLVALAGWSAWCLATVRSEAWGAALAWPLTRPMAFGLAGWVVAFGLPWAPLAALSASPTLRRGWPETARSLVVGWLQAAAAIVLAGSLIPGLADQAKWPALAGLAVAAAAVGDRLIVGWDGLTTRTRRAGVGIALAIGFLWLALAVPGGIYLAAAVPYYRGMAIAVAVFAAIATVVGAARTVGGGRAAGAALIGLLATISIGVKLTHAGIYAPEWNYRFSQGPWGRAYGQWVPGDWPIYATLDWPADLLFAAGHPPRKLAHPASLNFVDRSRPAFVLLDDGEFAHWPESAPPLVLVRRFEDDRGRVRVLARTEGQILRR